MPKTTSSGFTLIELLITISIVAIIASVGLVSFSTANEKARDERRKQDLRSIKGALEIYKFQSSTKSYPTTEGTCCFDGAVNSSSLSKPWISALTSSYINTVPVDPSKNQGNPISSASDILGYSYWAGDNSGGDCPGKGQYFILAAGLENKYDPDANLAKIYKDCSGNEITARENVYILTSEN